MRDKILLITPRIPYPPVGGDRIRAYNFTRILKKYFDLYLISLEDKFSSLSEETCDFLSQNFVEYRVFFLKKANRYLNSFRAYFSDNPIQTGYFYSKRVKKEIEELISRENFRLLFPFLIRTAGYVKDRPEKKIVELTDSIFFHYMDAHSKVNSLFWKAIYREEALRLFKFEREVVSSFDASIFVNFYETNFYERFGRVQWVPMGVNGELLNYNGKKEEFKDYISFIGVLSTVPNKTSLYWFLENVFPYIDRRIKFAILGTNPPEKLLKMAEKYNGRIYVPGYLKDPYNIISSSFLFVAPMQIGAGFPDKVLEAMALGKPVLTTTFAGKSVIGAKNWRDFIISDTAEEMYNTINRIFRGEVNVENIGENARRLVQNNYTWAHAEKNLISIIEEILKI